MVSADSGKTGAAAGGLNFRQLVFSGGGTRCFWHGGFMRVVRQKLQNVPERIASVSGGALSGACFIAGREQKLCEVMGARLEARAHNVSINWDELQENGLTPHQEFYGEVVKEVLDEEAVEAVANGPSFQVLLAHPPFDKMPKASTIPMMIAYEADLLVRSTPHVVMPANLGANEELVDARQAARDGKLHSLICNAAVIPPVFNIQGWNGRPVIDGGMTSKAPMPEPNEGNTLILLTRRFRNLPDEPDRLYVEPSEATPADKIDFTSREKIEETWKLGEEDGNAFLSRHGLI